MAGKNTQPPDPLDDVKITNAWKALIAFCYLRVPYGTIKLQIVNREPAKMLECDQDIDFRKQETYLSLFDAGEVVNLNGAQVFERLKR